MKTILFAWELGAHYGHIAQLIPVARRLQEMGCAVHFALGDISSAAELLYPEGMSFLQAPMVRQHRRYPGHPASYPDIMRRFGFGDAATLQSLVLGWRELYRLVDPDVIVLHNAPTATLASWGSGARRVTLGMGWDVPPLETPMRRFWPRANVSEAAIAAIQAEVELNVAAVLRELGEQSYCTLTQIFRTDQRLLCTLPELDHYPDRADNAIYVGPLFMGDAGGAVGYPHGTGPRTFIYLRDETPHYRDVLKALAGKDGRYIAVLPNLDSELRRQMDERGWQVHAQRVKLESLAGVTDIAITNAGHGVLSYFALKGVPCLYIPSNIDQLMLGSRAAEAGLGSLLRPGQAASIAVEMAAWSGSSLLRNRLDSFKERYRNVSVGITVELVLRHL